MEKMEKMEKKGECFFNYIIYEINIIISTLKLREFHSSSDQNYFILKLVFCYLHLISAFLSILSFSQNIYFKFSTLITYVLVLIFDNLDWSKKIKPFDLEIIIQFYFEFFIILNAFIICDLCKVIKKNCDENKKKNKKSEIGILLVDNEEGILNDNNENKDIKSSELPLVNKNGKHIQNGNIYSNRINGNENLISIEKYNNLLEEKEEESKKLNQLNSQKVKLLKENKSIIKK